MSKRLLDSDSDSSGSGSGSDFQKMMSLAKNKKDKATKKPKHDYTDSDSGSESDWASKKKKSKSSSSKKKSSKSRNDTSDSEDDNDTGRRGRDTTSAPDPKPRAPEDVEEGEVSSSDSDASSIFDDGYDDNYYGDEEDRKKLDAMTEREREELIYNRQVDREEKRQRWEIEKKLRRDRRLNEKKKQRREDKGHTEPSEAASETVFNKLDLKERSKERKKTQESKVDKKSTALDALKARREDRKARAEEKEKIRVEEEQKRGDADEVSVARHKDDASSTVSGKGKVQGRLKAEDVWSDNSDGSDSDDGKSALQRKAKKSDSESKSSDSEDERERKPQYVDEVADLNRIRLSRTKAERWIHHPFFPKVAKGCFVRIGIGMSQGVSLYRVGEIVDIPNLDRAYSLGQTKTDKGIRIRHGADEKNFRLEYISNQDFTAEEFERWVHHCRTKDVVLPTLDDVRKKEKELKEASNYQLKDEDVDFIIQEKQRFKQAPVNYAMQKAQLMKDREMAVANNDQKQAEKLRKAIDELEERAKELDKQRTQSISSIFYINERNRRRNIEEAEKAILEEVKANKGNKVDDPFTRRNTKPSRPSVKNNQGAVSSTGQDMNGNGKIEPPKPALVESNLFADSLNGAANDSEPEAGSQDGLPLPLPKLSEDLLDSKLKSKKAIKSTADLFSAHDFDLKIDLEAKLPSSEPVMSRPVMPSVREPAPIKRSLNLEDYKKKRGLI